MWGRTEAYVGFWWGNLAERDHLEDLGVDGRIILRWIFRKWDVEGMGSIELARDRDRWRVLVTAVMNIRVPYKAGDFLTGCETVRCSRKNKLHGVS